MKAQTTTRFFDVLTTLMLSIAAAYMLRNVAQNPSDLQVFAAGFVVACAVLASGITIKRAS